MKQLSLRLVSVLIVVLVISPISPVVYAMTPTLSVSATGSGDSVIITVYGDPNASVALYRQNSGYGTQTQYLGATNSNGYLTITVSSATYGITAGSLVYVMVNNQTSASVTWPYGYNNNNYNYGYGYGSLSLSQTNATLTVGQSTNITIYGGNTPYTMYSTGANVFQAVIGGNNLQITGLTSGSGSVNVCSSGGTGSGCAVLSITVSPANYYGGNNYYTPPIYNNPVQSAITFSPNNPTLSVGQSTTVSVSGGNSYNYGYYGGNYSIAYNSSSSVLSAVFNGSNLVLQGLANGNASVVVCSSTTNCSALNIIVGGINYGYSGNNYYGNNGNWVQCANENGFCSFSGTQNVRYGANGVYTYRMATNGTTCSNAVFGDPIFGVAKQCSIGGY